MLVKQIQKLKSIFMKKFSLLLFLFSLSFATLVNSCKQEASCTDGKQNQGETGIDCGDAAGKCPPCENAVSCSNGVQDGGELGVDCGGPCPNACQTNPTCTDGIQNGTETGVDCGGSCSPCGTGSGTFTCTIDGSAFSAITATGVATTGASPILVITGTNGTKSIAITHSGAFIPGTYPVSSLSPITYTNGTDACLSTSDGTLTFSIFDTATKKVSGTFTFNCVNATGGGGSAITTGVFNNVSYN